MSILINYVSTLTDDCPAEYEAAGEDARRVAAIIGHPGAVKVVTCIVTFFHEGVDAYADREGCKGSSDDAGTGELFTYDQLHQALSRESD